jgi:hypothetical protein
MGFQWGWSSRVASALSVSVIALTGLPGVARADAPERVTQDISEFRTDEFLSQECGTTVTVARNGTAEYTLWRNDAGLVVRELDRFPGATTTFSAPEQGGRSPFDTRLCPPGITGPGLKLALRRNCQTTSDSVHSKNSATTINE